MGSDSIYLFESDPIYFRAMSVVVIGLMGVGVVIVGHRAVPGRSGRVYSLIAKTSRVGRMVQPRPSAEAIGSNSARLNF